ncbi:hypothetical protein RCL1_005254 [Eukaryota sp. TZLM3-RCL]
MSDYPKQSAWTPVTREEPTFTGLSQPFPQSQNAGYPIVNSSYNPLVLENVHMGSSLHVVNHQLSESSQPSAPPIPSTQSWGNGPSPTIATEQTVPSLRNLPSRSFQDSQDTFIPRETPSVSSRYANVPAPLPQRTSTLPTGPTSAARSRVTSQSSQGNHSSHSFEGQQPFNPTPQIPSSRASQQRVSSQGPPTFVPESSNQVSKPKPMSKPFQGPHASQAPKTVVADQSIKRNPVSKPVQKPNQGPPTIQVSQTVQSRSSTAPKTIPTSQEFVNTSQNVRGQRPAQQRQQPAANRNLQQQVPSQSSHPPPSVHFHKSVDNKPKPIANSDEGNDDGAPRHQSVHPIKFERISPVVKAEREIPKDEIFIYLIPFSQVAALSILNKQHIIQKIELKSLKLSLCICSFNALNEAHFGSYSIPLTLVPCIDPATSDGLKKFIHSFFIKVLPVNQDFVSEGVVLTMKCVYNNSMESVEKLTRLDQALTMKTITTGDLRFLLFQSDKSFSAFLPLIGFKNKEEVQQLKQQIENHFPNCHVLFEDFANESGNGNIGCKFFIKDATTIEELQIQIQSFFFASSDREIKFLTNFNPNLLNSYAVLFEPLGPPSEELANKLQDILGNNVRVFFDRKLLYVLSTDNNFSLPPSIEIHANGQNYSTFVSHHYDPDYNFPIAHISDHLNLNYVSKIYSKWIEDSNYQYFEHHLQTLTDRNINGTVSPSNNHSVRLMNVIAQAATIKKILSRSYSHSRHPTQQVLRPLELTNTMYRFEDLFNVSEISASSVYPAVMAIKNQDCLEVAQSLGPRTAVLNMANAHYPGGGYKRGANAQEESLFRRTTLSAALDPDFVGIKHRESFNAPKYPWNFDVIVTENVEVFRKSESEALSFFNSAPFKLTVISTAAPQDPPTSEVQSNVFDYQNEQDRQLMFRRWNCVFLGAIKHGIDNLVISPLGCGAFP